MDLKNALKELAKEKYVDYFGVAPVERMNNAPAGSQPQEILPEARSIISLGIKMRSGPTNANNRAYNGHRMSVAIYMKYGMDFLNDVLDMAAYAVFRKLIDEGYSTLPLPAAHPYPYINQVIFGKNHECVNLFSNRHAAVAAGIGEFGWLSLVMTKDDGPRVRFASVLTEAELEPDPMYSGEQICKGDKCPNSLICAKICPMGAISLEKTRSLTIGGKNYSYGEVDFTKCVWGSLGLRKSTLGKVDCFMPEEKTPEALASAIMEQDPMERQDRFGNANMCGRCLIECPIGQENI